jgi:hypothetical protein
LNALESAEEEEDILEFKNILLIKIINEEKGRSQDYLCNSCRSRDRMTCTPSISEDLAG